MAGNNLSQSSIDTTLTNLYSQQSELDQSVSLLPQGPPMTIGAEVQSMSQTTSSESSFEISGFSSIVTLNDDSDSEFVDPFNNVFYRVFPSEKSTDIHFYARPMFKMIISVLEKEFSTPGEDVTKFLLKTHINGQKCNINVNRIDYTIIVTGPGHVTWKEKSFRKMTVNMFKKFVDQTNVNMNQQEDINPSETSITDNSSSSSASPNMRVISNLVDKINSLQREITKLTSEVNKLVRQAAESVIVSNVTNDIQKEDDSIRVNEENQDPLRHETSDLAQPNHVQEPNEHTHYADNVVHTHLTSTPAPGPGHTPAPLQETPQPTRQQPARPRPGTRPARPMQPQPPKKYC